MIHATPRYPKPPHKGRRRRRFGLTLIELLLALSVTAMVGMGVAGMMIAMSRGTEHDKHAVATAVSLHLVDARLTETLRHARKVLAVGDHYLVLWMTDPAATEDQPKPTRKTLKRIEYQPASDTLRVFAASPGAPSGWSNTEYDLNDTDFNAVTSGLISSPHYVEQVWSNSVTGWTRSLDNVDPQQARLVAYTLTIEQHNTSETRIGSVALRNH